MKNGIKILSILSIILLSGCSSSKELVTHCTLTNKNVVQNYELTTDYEIHSKDGIVTNVVTEEIVTSDDEEILDYFNEYISNAYAAVDKEYGGYVNDITIDGNKLTSKTKIDYEKTDLKKYIEDNSTMKQYTNKDNKITLEGSKKIYESLGAECK